MNRERLGRVLITHGLCAIFTGLMVAFWLWRPAFAFAVLAALTFLNTWHDIEGD